MKKGLLISALLVLMSTGFSIAQKLSAKAVPLAVRSELMRRYPNATKATWEKRKGNYRASFGGKAGKDNSVVISPASAFIEMGNPVDVKFLPQAVTSYVKVHYHAQVISADKIADATGKLFYVTRVAGDKEVLFDTNGKFIKVR